MTILDRAGLLAALAPRTQDVALPNGATARVRTISAADRIDIAGKAMNDEKQVDAARYSALMVAASVVDADGNLVFTDADVDLLMGSPSGPFEALFGAVQDINGTGAKAAEAAAGN